MSSVKRGSRRGSNLKGLLTSKAAFRFQHQIDGDLVSDVASNQISIGQSKLYENLMQDDIDFFESEVLRYQEQMQEGTLMQKRKDRNAIKSEPLEELGEVYVEVQILENDFKKCLDMCEAMIKNSRDQYVLKQATITELEALKKENQAIQNTTNLDTETRSKKHAEVVQKEMEGQIKALND